jgi:hypothetical protein
MVVTPRLYDGLGPRRRHVPPDLRIPDFPHSVPRQRDMLRLRTMLGEGKDDASARAAVVSAVHGMGGVGKTTLVACLAREIEKEGRFPDGILWVTLGEEPAGDGNRTRIGRLVGYFGQARDISASIDSLREQLDADLADRSALIVLEDSGRRAVPRRRPALPNRCHHTRFRDHDGAGGRDLAARPRRYDARGGTFADPQASRAALARRRRGRPGRRSGRGGRRLPLALALVAAQVADGEVAWVQVLAELRREVARLEAIERLGATSMTIRTVAA